MSRISPLFIFALLCMLLCLCAVLSLRYGAAVLSLSDLLVDARGILSSRLFRTLCAMMVGAALAISGLLLQALTGNPLADPGITGINAGAALAAIGLAYVLPQSGAGVVLITASLGAGLSGIALWQLAGGQSATGMGEFSLRLPLAGLAIEALCLGLASTLILTDAEMQTRYLRWLSGAIPAVDRGEAVPLIAIAVLLVTGFFICERLEILSLGSEQSDSLGRSSSGTVALVLAHVTLLSGAAVAIAGPLAFLGLLVPFLARALSGGVLKRAYLFALPMGAAALVLSDTLGRVIARPGEVNAGIITALLGGPALVFVLRYLLRYDREGGV